MSQVILVCPGSTDFDDNDRIQGGLDLPLNENGIAQVKQLLAQLHDVKLEAVYAAPNGSAKQTADEIAAMLGIPVKTNEDLRNLNQGLWQGLQIDEVRRKYPRVIKQWEESPETICPPGGETISEAMTRIKKVLQKPLSKNRVFAVVASDPAYSLIRQIILGHDDISACPICNGDRGANWELVCTPGDEVKATMPTSPAGTVQIPSIPSLTATVQPGVSS